MNTQPWGLVSGLAVDYKYWAATSNQFPCKLVDLFVADKTEFVETADIVVVGIDGVVAAEIDMVVVDTSFDHCYSLVVGCIDMDAFYHSVIGQLRSSCIP